jgi:PAS domain S-box-containing protein
VGRLLRKKGASDFERTPSDGELLARLMTLSYEAMFAWRLDGSIEFWNAGAARLYGFGPDEAIGHSSHALLQTKFPIDLIVLRSQLREKGEWRGELRHNRKDGGGVVVESRMQLFSDDIVLEANRDISEQKEIQSILREAELQSRFLASIVESSDDIIVSKNLDGIITSWNRCAERTFGYSAGEAIGQPITIVIPDDRQSEEREILTRIRRGERIDHFETVRRRRDGSLVNVSLTVSPIKDRAGRIVGASKVARDITQQKRDAQLIATLAREAEHRSKNMLSTAMAAVNLSRASSAEDLKQVIVGRLGALSNVCSLFVESRWLGAELSAVVAQELAPYSEKFGNRVMVEGPQILLEPSVAQAIAITLHELATNAAKYGALSYPSGKLEIRWSDVANGELRLSWTETGGREIRKPQRTGVGSRIIEAMTAQQQGSVQFDWREGGLVCEIVMRVEL